MSRFYFIILILISKQLFAVQSCGTYQLTGKYLIKDNNFFYVVYEKSNSELNFAILKKEDREKISSFIDKETEIKTDIIKLDGTNGTLENIEEIKLVVPDPLMFNSSKRINLLTKKTCRS